MTEQKYHCNELLKFIRNCNKNTPNIKYCWNLQNLYHEFCVEMSEANFAIYQNNIKNSSFPEKKINN